MRRGLAAVLVPAAALVALGGGCGGPDRCASAAGTRATTVPASGTERGYLTGVALSKEAGCDRLVLRFEDGLPGARVGYEPAAQALTEDASGRRLSLRGSAFLVVRLEPTATARISDAGEVTLTYEGPNRLDGDGDPVTGALKTGDFEAVVRWTVGLADRRPFAVRAEAERIVVEIG